MKIPTTFIVLMLMLSFSALEAFGCPTCGKAVEVLPDSAEASTAGGGFNSSIYLLLGTVIGAMGFLVWTFTKAGKTPVPNKLSE